MAPLLATAPLLVGLLIIATATRPCAGAAAAAAAAAPKLVPTGRPGVPMCSWFAYDSSVPSAGYCKMDDAYILAITAAPTTFIAKQLTRAYGRHRRCGALAQRAACQASRLGCSWREPARAGAAGSCGGAERAQWDWFSRHAYIWEAPAWMLCPGSQAAVFRRCAAAAPGACAAAGGCALSGGSCSAEFLLKMDEAQRGKWQDRFAALDPEIMGGCGWARYLEGVTACSGAWKEPPSKRRAACDAAGPGGGGACYWEAGSGGGEEGGACRPVLMGRDAWGKAAAVAASLCAGLSKDNSTCIGGSPRAGPVLEARIEAFLDFVQPAGSTRA